jgi:hypothetical protein
VIAVHKQKGASISRRLFALPMVLAVGALASSLRHILGGRALLPLHEIELYRVAFGQCLESVALDGAVVDEAVLVSAIWCDEAETLGVVEPLHLSGRAHIPLLKVLRYNTMLRGQRAQGETPHPRQPDPGRRPKYPDLK